MVSGGERSWVNGGPTGRAALRRGWRIALDPYATGTARGWRHGRFPGRRVSVPYVPNARQLTPESFAGSVAWYRRDLVVPRSGRYVPALRVGQPPRDRLARRPQGRHPRRRPTCPSSSALSLDARRTHRLVVRADWRDPERMKAEGFHRTWFNFGGINREVTLRRSGTAELAGADRAHAAAQRAHAGRRRRRRAQPGATTRAVDVQGVLAGAGKRLVFRIPGVTTRPGDAHVAAHDAGRPRGGAVVARASPTSTTSSSWPARRGGLPRSASGCAR